MRAACRSYRVYYTKPTAEEVAAGDYLLDHSIISYLVDPDGKFLEYFGKSLSADEMEAKMGKVIGEWETRAWWDSILPEWMQLEPKKAPGAAAAAAAARA